MKQALADIKEQGCNALCVYLGNFGPEISETMLAQQFDGPTMFVDAAEESIGCLSDDRGDAYCGKMCIRDRICTGLPFLPRTQCP